MGTGVNNDEVIDGATVTVTCELTGGATSYKWEKDDQEESSETAATFTFKITDKKNIKLR